MGVLRSQVRGAGQWRVAVPPQPRKGHPRAIPLTSRCPRTPASYNAFLVLPELQRVDRMRWSIIGIIWLRELRDQLRDRRTLFMVAGLPLLVYPILGVAVLKFAVGFVERKTTVGIVAGPQKDFPPPAPPLPAASWVALTPCSGGLPVVPVAGAAAL